MKTSFFVIVAILQVAIALLPSLGKLYFEDQEETKTFKITPLGIVFVCLVIISLGFTIGLYFVSENEDQKNKSKLEQQQDKRDSTITAGITQGVDSNRKILFNELSEALANQNLRFDTFTNTLNKISDSSKKTITNYAQIDPTLAIESGGFRLVEQSGYRYAYNYDITSYGAASTNFDLYLYLILIPKTGPNKYVGKLKCLTSKTQISANGKISNISAELTSKVEFIGFYVYINGSYTSADGQKKYPCDQLYQFHPSNNSISLVVDEEQKNLILMDVPK